MLPLKLYPCTSSVQEQSFLTLGIPALQPRFAWLPSALLPVRLVPTFAITVAFASIIIGFAHDQPAPQAIEEPKDRCYHSPSSHRDGDSES